MATTQLSPPISAHIPDELWLHILTYLAPKDIWSSARPINQQLTRICSDLLLTDEIMRKFTVGVSISLGAGTRHRWYDIRGTLTFSFQSFSKHNGQYALFGACLAHPSACYDRAMEKWKRMSADGLGERQEWRVQHGYEGDLKYVRLPKLIVAAEQDGGGVWCDWREMFDAYFGVLEGATGNDMQEEGDGTRTDASAAM
ncbi:hypothetical protein LTR85_002092 [Meristemomyces frigidus]|nr:hypothetical protein LTR85_002092 [Meristemomyces frigidus]